MFKNNKDKISSLIFTLILFIIPLFSPLMVLPTYDFKLNSFFDTFIENKMYGDFDDYKYPIIRITPKNDTDIDQFSDLYNFYNSDISLRTCRKILSDKFSYDIIPDKIKFISQPKIAVSNDKFKSENKYAIGNRQLAYFPGNFLGNTQEMLTPRFGASSYVYINDSYADILLDFYGINSYGDLIKEEKYSLLKLTNENGKILKVSINNILYSDFKDGKRTSDIYGNFGIIYYNNLIREQFNLSFEMDIKDSLYANKRNIYDLFNRGYLIKDYDYNFIKYDYLEEKYINMDNLNSIFYAISIDNTNNYIWFVYAFIVASSLVALLILYLITKNKNRIKSSCLLFIFFSILANIVILFFEMYPYFLIPSLLFFILSFCASLREINSFFSKVIYGFNNYRSRLYGKYSKVKI